MMSAYRPQRRAEFLSEALEETEQQRKTLCPVAGMYFKEDQRSENAVERKAQTRDFQLEH